MFWTVFGLLAILFMLGIASQSQDFIVDAAPLDCGPESGPHQTVYKPERTAKPAAHGLREPIEC